jgi:glyceraldehyde 3-phosphate dehydrogenase
MTIRVAINGFGRIGRNIVRALYESDKYSDIQIIAINDLADTAINAHLLKYDSTHGIFAAKVEHKPDAIYVNQDKIIVLNQADPCQLPWQQLAIDIVLECSGVFNDRIKAAAHLTAGAKKVLISAPAKGADATIVYGVNHQNITADMTIISNASCTTNCLVPVVHPLQQALGIESGLMTTIHAYTSGQRLTDGHHQDPRRARAAAMSMIPTKTGAAAAVGLVLPELAGKLDGLAVRVPTLNVSLIDLTFLAATETSVEEVNNIICQAANTAPLNEVLAVNTIPLVSIDFNHHPMSAIFDTNETRVQGRLVKVMAWYDNEWGFSNRMLDNTLHLKQYL